MKTPEATIAALAATVKRRWADWILTHPQGWPIAVPIGEPTRSCLQRDYESIYLPVLQAWDRWEHNISHPDIALRRKRRLVGKLQLDVPTHLDVKTLDAAASVVGKGWIDQINTTRSRLEIIRTGMRADVTSALVREVTTLTAVDFTLLCHTAAWMRDHDTTGLTARQVPIPGLHAKWLDSHRSLVLALSNRDNLNLVDRPQRLDLTYLDPDWRAAGGRLRDSLATDDPQATIGYQPTVVIVTENRDSALFFPPIPGGIAIEGGGNAIIKRISQYPWIQTSPRLIYWGDLDADGLEILARLRATCKRGVDSILMDMTTYRRYIGFGVRVDRHGKYLKTDRDPTAANVAAAQLTPDECALYEYLRDPTHEDPLRIEQERIPLQDAECTLMSSGE